MWRDHSVGKMSLTNISIDIGVSINGGTPKSSTLKGFSLINHPFLGSPNCGNLHIGMPKLVVVVPCCSSCIISPPKEKWRWTWCEDGIWAMFTEILRRLGKDKVPRWFDDSPEIMIVTTYLSGGKLGFYHGPLHLYILYLSVGILHDEPILMLGWINKMVTAGVHQMRWIPAGSTSPDFPLERADHGIWPFDMVPGSRGPGPKPHFFLNVLSKTCLPLNDLNMYYLICIIEIYWIIFWSLWPIH